MLAKEAALTECQLARMHYLLESGDNKAVAGGGSDAWKTIATDYCNKDETNPIVIAPGQNVVWAAGKKLNTDIVVQPGAQLLIRCRTGLPTGARITVERGARLIVDGGTITHNREMWPRCEGGTWEGIFVDGEIKEIPAGELIDTAALPDPRAPGAVWLRDARIAHAREGLVQGTAGVE
jgi:hypothetical protein